MAPEVRHSGGTREFAYSKEDEKRIRSEETSSTKAFKEEYAKWQQEREIAREREAETRRRLLIILAALGAVIILIALLWFLLAS